MDNESNKTVIFDAQILQTPARDRGMGQYVTSLLKELAKRALKDKFNIIIINSFSNGLSDVPKAYYKDFDKNKYVKVVNLPLRSRYDNKNAEDTINHNKQILNEWVVKNKLESATFILGSIYQLEIYPSCPDDTFNMAIMYDLIPLQQFKEYEPKMDWDNYLTKFKLLYKLDKILCISKTTFNDIQVYCSISETNLVLINGGTGSELIPKKPKILPTKPFLLMPTGNDIRKNNAKAVSAFEQFLNRTAKDYELVITSSFSNKEKHDLRKLSCNIIFTDSVSNGELGWYYHNCEAVLFPSLYEGLGMPIIEAMQFKKPIIASSIDVFLEISDSGIFFINPVDQDDIANKISMAISEKLSKTVINNYDNVCNKYSWENCANSLLEAIGEKKVNNYLNKKKIAILGPHYTGVSAIGKFIFELHQELSKRFEVDYYYEISPVDDYLRPNIPGSISRYYPITHLTPRNIKKYDELIYNIGNSNHHTITTALALINPGIAILHDLNNTNIYNDLLSKRLIDKHRYEIEEQLTKEKTSKASFLYSVVNRQKAIITHSRYAKKVVTKLNANKVTTITSQLPIDTPFFEIARKNKIFTIGMAGIIAGVKGVKTIERIASSESFKYDKIIIFGFNFAEPGLLERLLPLPNVEIITNLTDYEFQENLKKLDVFVNFRTKYQGEASQATLEAMRYGIPVIVRGDFGWYSELPDGAVVKVNDEEEVITAVIKLKSNPKYSEEISRKARTATCNFNTSKIYVDNLYQLIN